jgi:hypothetical protein
MTKRNEPSNEAMINFYKAIEPALIRIAKEIKQNLKENESNTDDENYSP